MVNLFNLGKKGMSDVMPDEFKVRMSNKVPNIILASREKIVNTKDIVSSFL